VTAGHCGLVTFVHWVYRSTGRAKKVTNEKCYTAGILAVIFTKFEKFAEDGFVHISCKFY